MGITAHQLKLTAIHEAGHAVACWYLNIPFKYVTVVPEGTTHGHIAHYKIRGVPGRLTGNAAEAWAVDRTERTIIWLFCGQLAQRRLRPRSHWRKAGASDFATAGDLFARLCDTDAESRRLYARLLWRRAEVLVEDYWRHIKAVALELRVLRRLSYEYVLQTIERVNRRIERRRTPAQQGPGSEVIRDFAPMPLDLLESKIRSWLEKRAAAAGGAK